jgi:hypothetical protein
MTCVARSALAPGRHRGAAFRADLGVFSVHASRDFCFVWDEFGAQSHRIRRAGLADVRRDRLGIGPMQAADQKRANRQRQAADQSNGSHVHFPQTSEDFRFGAKLAAGNSAVDVNLSNFG